MLDQELHCYCLCVTCYQFKTRFDSGKCSKKGRKPCKWDVNWGNSTLLQELHCHCPRLRLKTVCFNVCVGAIFLRRARIASSLPSELRRVLEPFVSILQTHSVCFYILTHQSHKSKSTRKRHLKVFRALQIASQENRSRARIHTGCFLATLVALHFTPVSN